VCKATNLRKCRLYRPEKFHRELMFIPDFVIESADITNALIGHDWRTLIGVPVGGSMLVYLVKSRRVLSR
jgi:hypothetical protein